MLYSKCTVCSVVEEVDQIYENKEPQLPHPSGQMAEGDSSTAHLPFLVILMITSCLLFVSLSITLIDKKIIKSTANNFSYINFCY